MNKNQKVELLKYSSPYSILVVGYDDKLMELRCPFKVEVRESFGSEIKGEILDVNKVLLSERLTVIFQINNRQYHHYHFHIVI